MYPKIKSDNKQRYYVLFYSNEKRYRIYNGSKINSNLYPNSHPINQRYEIAKLLCAEVYKHLLSGLGVDEPKKVLYGSDKKYLQQALNNKLKGDYSSKYKAMLQWTYNRFVKYIENDKISSNNVNNFLNQYTKGSSYNSLRRHLNALINEAKSLGMDSNPMKDIKAKKSKAKLHKPYREVSIVLDDIRKYNDNLYLCSLITYGCLLRPHREIRELTWSDFNSDLTQINLSGDRNKSGRNRIVPIPKYVSELLTKGEPNHNIFTNTTKPPNKDYFKTLWSRYKKTSDCLEDNQTLYSFRHTGAIKVFNNTKDITKLQKAMGHASINVSLTYLRGLEVTELEVSDMPTL
ncbi:tyrosine-type recombinase/integrase [Winogradskyella sp.]|nr:tyrosine-type recombinase/integrase [Winogradskyella sp.]MDB4752189.1 tyrosine-type recombinase/integrase [Winogradskyella sp.]